MKQHLIVISILLATSITPGVQAKETVNYKPASIQLQKAWLELYRLPKKNRLYEERQNVRIALKYLYQIQGREEEANFISKIPEPDLAEAITQNERNESTSFPRMADGKPVYRVKKQKNGTLNFSPITGCTGQFSITPNSRHFKAACKHVGKLAMGETIVVPQVPFRAQMTPDELVLRP